MESSKEKEFKQLIQRHKETIYTVCLMNAVDQDEAQDLMQEALVQLWRSFGTFRGESNEKTWIWRICNQYMHLLYAQGGETPRHNPS